MNNQVIKNRNGGHLFILCGPPGSGKTTLLKMIQNEGLSVTHLQRLTTREPRIEEGDVGNSSLEYEFLSQEEFAGRISRGFSANLIEWNNKYYATETDPIYNALAQGKTCLLYEDIPSSLTLKREFGSNATVILLYTEEKDDLLKVEFGTIRNSNRPSVKEWRNRLVLKFKAAKGNVNNNKEEENQYLSNKLKRAIPDLAFITGKIRIGEDVRVLANKKDKQQDTLKNFIEIVNSVTDSKVSDNPGKFAFVLMPFKDNFNKLYRFVIKPAVEREGITCLRGDEIFTQLNIMDDIMKHIESSSLIISDITGGNPNVFLELGVSMKMNKPIILPSQDSESPFDVRTCRWIKYQDTLGGWEYLSNQLNDALRKIKRNDDVG